MGHHAVVFPVDISYGSASGWGFDHSIVETGSGFTEYVAHYSDMRHTFDVAWGVKSWADAMRVKDFYAARGGLSNSFLFVDPMDMNTSSAPFFGQGGPGTPTGDDVVVEPAATAGQTTVQLIKRYTSGGIEHIRTIRHPAQAGDVMALGHAAVAAPILKVNGTTKTEATHYTINYSTGIVTFTAGNELSEDDVVTAGFSFYERVRFGAEVDRLLAMNAATFGTTNSRSPIPLVAEIQGVYHRDEIDHGGGSTITESVSYSPAIHKSGVLIDLAANATIVMPDAADFPIGGMPYATFTNTASGFTATFKDQAGATLWTVPSGGMVMAVVMQDSTPLWYGFKSA